MKKKYKPSEINLDKVRKHFTGEDPIYSHQVGYVAEKTGLTVKECSEACWQLWKDGELLRVGHSYANRNL